jgi:malate/lactate dehydrogenase
MRSKLGRKGVEQILEVELSDEGKDMLIKSVELIRGPMGALRR